MAAVPFPPAPPAAMASPLPMVAVVGQQFCAPYVVALTVTKKALSLSDGDFVVSDVNGAVLMKVRYILATSPLQFNFAYFVYGADPKPSSIHPSIRPCN